MIETAGLLIALLGIYLAIRRKGYPASLSFLLEPSVSLVDDFAQKVPDLDVSYRQQPVERGVVLVSGHVINDGSVDITPEMVELPLCLSFQGESQLLEIEITAKSDSLVVDCARKGARSVEFIIGLFRKRESFSFQALVLLDGDQLVGKTQRFPETKWTHRIASLGQVKTGLIAHPGGVAEMLGWRAMVSQWSAIIVSGLMVPMYLSLTVAALLSVGPLAPDLTMYIVAKGNGKTAEHALRPIDLDRLRVIDRETGASEELTLEEYLSTYEISLAISPQAGLSRGWSIALTVLLLAASIATGHLIFRRNIDSLRQRRLVAMLERRLHS